MDNETYENILLHGEKTEWYGIEVPSDLLTPIVRLSASNISEEIDKLESTIDGLSGNSLEKRKWYIRTLKKNLQNLPYSLNGDFYLKKKERIESKIENTKKTKQKRRSRKRTTSNNSVTSKSVKTKNSELIFGKNKK